MLGCLLTSTAMVMTCRFDPSVAAELIQKYRATLTVGAITVFTALLNDPGVTKSQLSSFRLVNSGGAPISPATVKQFYDKFSLNILPMYGLTETTAPSHGTPTGKIAPVDEKTGAISIGIPIFGVQSWIVDDNKKPMPDGEIGEIAIQGPQVVPGYWQKPEETQKAFSPDGILYTGDMGLRNKDGWFFIVDRKKDLIIASGYKIWPKEVEDCLYELECVNECAVVGVPCPYRGENVKAYVSLKSSFQGKVSTQIFIDHCKSKISAYKVPRSVEIVDEIPKNLSGKILRRVLRDANTNAKL